MNHANPEAEAAILGSIMEYGAKPYLEASRTLTSPEAFYDLRNQGIWRLLGQMVQDQIAITYTSFLATVQREHAADTCGGLTHVNAVQAKAMSSEVSNFVAIVGECWAKRRVQEACRAGVDALHVSQGDAQATIDHVVNNVLVAAKTRASMDEVLLGDLMPGFIDRLEAAMNGQNRQGYKTGLTCLDAVIGGLRPKEMVVIGARPSVGKTALAMQIALNIALNDDVPIGVFSCEMDKDAIADRVVSMQARVNMVDIRRGFLDEHDLIRVKSGISACRKAKVFIDDTPNVTAQQFTRRCMQMVEQRGVKLIVLDYLQLMAGGATRNRYEAITEISRTVKGVTKLCGIPVLVLCQLNRDSDKNPREPRSSDLRESGQIEQDADIIILAHKLEPSDVEIADGTSWTNQLKPDDTRETGQPWHIWGRRVNLIIDKNRNGPTGTGKLFMQTRTMRFESL